MDKYFQAESYTTSHYLDGINSKGRFGHAVASLKDLNQDGYEGIYFFNLLYFFLGMVQSH